jgi:hypothetical protein
MPPQRKPILISGCSLLLAFIDELRQPQERILTSTASFDLCSDIYSHKTSARLAPLAPPFSAVPFAVGEFTKSDRSHKGPRPTIAQKRARDLFRTPPLELQLWTPLLRLYSNYRRGHSQGHAQQEVGPRHQFRSAILKALSRTKITL